MIFITDYKQKLESSYSLRSSVRTLLSTRNYVSILAHHVAVIRSEKSLLHSGADGIDGHGRVEAAPRSSSMVMPARSMITTVVGRGVDGVFDRIL